MITTRREGERSDKAKAAERPRPKREVEFRASWPKPLPVCPAFLAARMTSLTKLFGLVVPWRLSPMRPGRIRKSSDGSFMTAKPMFPESDGGRCLDSVGTSVGSGSRQIVVGSRNSNPTNQMRTTAVGAFILQSAAEISPPPLAHVKACDNPRRNATKHDLAHGDLVPLARRTNRLLDCGTRADRSTMTWVRDDRLLDNPAGDLPSAVMPALPSAVMPAARVGNNEALAQANDLATALGCTSAGAWVIIGASVAT